MIAAERLRVSRRRMLLPCVDTVAACASSSPSSIVGIPRLSATLRRLRAEDAIFRGRPTNCCQMEHGQFLTRQFDECDGLTSAKA